MGAIRGWVSDSLDYRNFALVVKALDRIHRRMEPDLVVDVEHIGGVNAHRLAIVGVMRVVVGNDGVQGVIGARHLQHHQNPVFLIGRHRVCLLLSNIDTVPARPSGCRIFRPGRDAENCKSRIRVVAVMREGLQQLLMIPAVLLAQFSHFLAEFLAQFTESSGYVT